ncbi:cell division protein ZapA [Pseudorhizobium halotolerans]|jgi:cell division protein ZapA|uniref:Cell division protein ZapA n=1 Tax=Pseudorhizobium halotolerans TaxID=1233081 RepID=A0ABM8PZ45_9HYPH|nr:cell division protein ZapA [Pseudorhizobium halotolerans]CAD6600429.1 cell division protein ZapA [Rhizobium sp. Khangiran2]CAD7055721.1 cell division protein ZapA [Pseudorhizobium halotolerans]
MAQVTVTIDGKAYRMACEEGQEDHLTGLAARFDQYVGHLKSQFGEIGDLRITVMAGIMVMDELSELSRKVANLEAEVEKLNSARAGALEDRDQNEQVLVSTLSELTGRLDSLAAKLTGRTTSLN